MIRRVLLVCSGNTCRSPMAAMLMKDLWQQANPGWDLEVLSAGTGAIPGDLASQHAVTAMSARGLDLSAHRSRKVEDQTVAATDLILTMTGRHKEQILSQWPTLSGRVHTLSEYAGSTEDIADPFGGTLRDYEATASALEAKLKAIVDRIRKEGASSQ
ncbi:MAG TPA: low molecular weight protein arginine phosphatase [Symbiobacteriaceae bacterium]|nr:low molecular weight protein arginine phosphatase [Symbiobacteriaceae bacterium]